MTSTSVFRPLVLGVVTGLRSQLGLAVLAWSEPASKQDTRALRLLRSAPGRGLTGVGAAAELVAEALRLASPCLRDRALAAKPDDQPTRDRRGEDHEHDENDHGGHVASIRASAHSACSRKSSSSLSAWRRARLSSPPVLPSATSALRRR